MLGGGWFQFPDLNFWTRSEAEKKAVFFSISHAAEFLRVFGTAKFESQPLVQFDLQPSFSALSFGLTSLITPVNK